MGLVDREYMKESGEAAAPTWWNRLNDFGERNARTIILLSVALLVGTAFVVTKSYFDRKRQEEGLRRLDSATTLEDLQKLQKEFSGDAYVEPRVLYALANRLHEELNLTEAQQRYEEFRRKYPQDALIAQVEKAYSSLTQNRQFLDTERKAMEKATGLRTHPTARTSISTPGAPVFGPEKQENPLVTFELPDHRLVNIELYEDDAPNTVANFIELTEKNYFQGLKFSKSDGKHLRIEAKKDGAALHLLTIEPSSRKPVPGSLVMAKTPSGGENLGAEFLVLLEEDPSFAAATIFGRIPEGNLPVLQSLSADDSIRSVRVDRKRSHEYKAVPAEKK